MKVALTEGPSGLWRMVVERLTGLGQIVLESAVRWVMTRIVAIVGARLASLAASAGWSLVIEAVVVIYQAIRTAMEYAQRILQILLTAFNTVAQIAQGVIGPAATMIENGLRMVLPIIIGFLANYAGLGGISNRIRDIIGGVRERVDAAILWLIDRGMAVLQGILNLIRRGVAAVTEWWRIRKGFTGADRRPHTISLDRRGNQAVITVRTLEKTLDEIIAAEPEPKKTQLNDKYSQIKGLVSGLETEVAKHQERHSRVSQIIDEIVTLLGPGEARPTVVTHAIKSSGTRAHRIIAEPLTSRPGNTAGQRAQGEIIERELFFSFVRPVSRPRTIKGKQVWVESLSMIRGAHLLADTLHGPTDRWDIANASTSINELMKAPEKKAKELTDAKFELGYRTTVEYYNDAPEPPRAKDAVTSLGNIPDAPDDIKVSTVRNWLGFYFARTFSVELSIVKAPAGVEPPKNQTYGPFTSNIEHDLPLRVDPSPPNLEDRVFAAALATNVSGRVIPYKELAKMPEIQVNNTEVLEVLTKLVEQGRLRKTGRFYYISANPVLESDV